MHPCPALAKHPVANEVIVLLLVILMTIHRPLFGHLFCEDILAPVVALQLLLSGEWRVLLSRPLRLFSLAIGVMLVMTLSHLPSGGEDGYNIAVLIYLLGLCAYVQRHPLSAPAMLTLGAAILVFILAFWLGDLFAFTTTGKDIGVCFHGDDVAQTDNLSFLARRYAFFFGNPNTLGAFYPLPMFLFLQGLKPKLRSLGIVQWTVILLFIGLCLLPLVMTFSKHAILTGALILAFLVTAAEAHLPRWATRISWLPILFIGIICEITVQWVAFPVSSRPPFINAIRGMYAVHQDIYYKIGTHSLPAFLTGCSPATIHKLYPTFANPDAIAKTLGQYNALGNLDGFCTFMDPHCEYLNLLAFYGLPALALLVIAFIALAKTSSRMMRYFILALAFACLWDDLLSKRWIWVTLALLIATGKSAGKRTTIAP